MLPKCNSMVYTLSLIKEERKNTEEIEPIHHQMSKYSSDLQLLLVLLTVIYFSLLS